MILASPTSLDLVEGLSAFTSYFSPDISADGKTISCRRTYLKAGQDAPEAALLLMPAPIFP